MSALGYPLLTDGIYGPEINTGTASVITRVALHSWRLAFLHPHTREALTVTGPIPPDFQNLLNIIGVSADLL
jgi:23S rRNA pseudouridine1911/1915/1917 synthase